METVVTTKQGRVQGLTSPDGKTRIFRGIPYAAPPVGELRFRRPRAHAPWEGALPCVNWGSSCPQADLTAGGFYAREFYDQGVPPLDEDCLYLNIWTPADAGADSALPVLFWIHGGAFMHGSGSEKEFDGEAFARQGVLLVTINYRVNAFGFFTHPQLESESPEGVSGNWGILDQLFALQWVRENIRAFGGDPEKITLFGQSAGCMSVQTIVSSPLSRGMFRGAVLQSGGGIGALPRDAGKEGAQEISRRLMEHLEVSTVAQLRALPWEAIRDAAYAVGGSALGWGPHVDGWLLPENTDDAALHGNIADAAYLIGSCGNDIGEGGQLLEAGRRFCRNLLALGRRPAYHYYFDRKLPGDDAGAFHSGELWYVFSTLGRCWRPFTEHDYALSDRLSAYWANFAKTGDPNGPGLPLWQPSGREDSEPLLLA